MTSPCLEPLPRGRWQSNAVAASGKFGSNVPERLILHWDGKKITNMVGDPYEALVVLV